MQTWTPRLTHHGSSKMAERGRGGFGRDRGRGGRGRRGARKDEKEEWGMYATGEDGTMQRRAASLVRAHE